MTDIRVGDLIRATGKSDPELIVQGRVKVASTSYYSISGRVTWRDMYDFEVLERPAPKVEDDLLEKVMEAYRKAEGWDGPVAEYNRVRYFKVLTPVINAVREYDKKAGAK